MLKYIVVLMRMERIKSKLKSCGQQSCISQDECRDRLKSLLAVFSFLVFCWELILSCRRQQQQDGRKILFGLIGMI